MKSLLRLFTFSFVLLLFVPLSAQDDWNIKAEGEQVQVQQGKNWITVNSKGITEQLLTETEKLMELRMSYNKIRQQIEAKTKSINSFKELKGLVEAEELSIKEKAKELAANPPTKKKDKKTKKKAAKKD